MQMYSTRKGAIKTWGLLGLLTVVAVSPASSLSTQSNSVTLQNLPVEGINSILEYVPENLEIFVASNNLLERRSAALLPLNEETTRRYIANEDGFQDQVNRTRDNPRKQVRLNLGENFREYIINPEFRANIDNLVDNPLEQIYSDVEELNLAQTQVADISPLAGLKNLKLLYLFGTQVTDISALAGLENLQSLCLSYTRVTNLSPLAGLKNLRWLTLERAQVSDISPLAGLENLEYLCLSYTQVTDIGPLGELVNLRYLYLFFTQVSDISRLAGLNKLEWLNLSDTQVAVISPLAELQNLKTLWVSALTDVSSLRSLEGLTICRF